MALYDNYITNDGTDGSSLEEITEFNKAQFEMLANEFADNYKQIYGQKAFWQDELRYMCKEFLEDRVIYFPNELVFFCRLVETKICFLMKRGKKVA